MAVWSLWILCGVALLAVKGDSAMYIRVCSNEKRTAIEETNVTFICGQYSNGVEWSLSYSNWPGYFIGYCYKTECDLYNGVNIPVNISSSITSVSESYESQLYIKVVTREQAYKYYCRNTQSGEIATCGLRVIAPAIIIGEKCSVRVSNWQIYGTCAVERMYASDDVYNCTWRRNDNKIRGGFQELITYGLLQSRLYRKGVCSFSQNMPVDPGNYTFSMDIDPGSQNLFYAIVNIVPPGEPNHDCPETVFKGSNVSCKCTSSYPGAPPAEFAWDGSGTDTLSLQNISPENTSINYCCRLIWGSNGYINRTIVYTLRIAEKEKTALSDNAKGGIIGGCVAAVFILAIIGVVIAVYIVKCRRGKCGRGNINLRFWQCLCKFFHQKKPPTTPYAVVNKPKSQFPIRRQAASSGDLYTVAMTTTSSDLNGEYVTICETNQDAVSEINREGNNLASQGEQEMTESRTAVAPAMKSKPMTPGTRNVSDIPGYMNVTEVPTVSGLGVYHVVASAVTPTGLKPDILNNHEAGISEEEYHALHFEEDRTAQEDQASTYHHLQHE